MTIALLSAWRSERFFTALVITGFVLAAEVLEGLTVGEGDVPSRTFSFPSPNGHGQAHAQVVEIAADQVRVGDTVIVNRVDIFPSMASCLAAAPLWNRQPLRGEAMPVEKVLGDVVYAGTMNQSGALENNCSETWPRHDVRKDR